MTNEKGEMRYGGVLTRIHAGESFCFCGSCGIVYQDNCKEMGSLRCSFCKSLVVRGLSREEAKEYVSDEYKELLS